MSDPIFRSPYPHYDVLAKRDSPSWDDRTRAVVDARLHDVPPRRFLTEHEWSTLEAICDRLLPQPERGADKVPIVPFIDQKLERGASKGYRFPDLPPLREAVREGLRGTDDESTRRFGQPFVALDAAQKDEILSALQRGEPQGEAFQVLSPRRFFHDVLLSEALAVYYAHPSAWSEIGFGGPASPRGYLRLEVNRADPWEAKKAQPEDEHR